MIINGIKIEKTFAEAFPMKATRIIVTAETKYWVSKAVESMMKVLVNSSDRELEELLKIAVQNENYESAAKIRDEISNR